MNKKIYIALMLLFALVLTACTESEIEKTDAAESDEEKPKETKEETQELAIGEAVNFDGLKITLNEARIEPGGDFDEPQEEQFVVVNLTAENSNDEEETVSSIMNVELKDQDGYSYNTTILAEGIKGQFDGTIESGGTLRGEIPFDVPQSSEYELHFSNPFTSGKAIWKIPADQLQ